MVSATQGKYLLDTFPTYELIPYEHWLYCHLWEFMVFWNGVGRFSSVVVEAANKKWKRIAMRHEQGNGKRKAESAFNKVYVSSHPKVRRLE